MSNRMKRFLHKCWFTLQCRAIEANECHQEPYNCSRAHVEMDAFCIFKIGNTFLFMYSKHKTFGMYNVGACMNQMSACVCIIYNMFSYFVNVYFWVPHLIRWNQLWMLGAKSVAGENPSKWILNAEQLTWISPWKIIYFSTPNDTCEMLKCHIFIWNAFFLLDIFPSMKCQFFFILVALNTLCDFVL